MLLAAAGCATSRPTRGCSAATAGASRRGCRDRRGRSATPAARARPAGCSCRGPRTSRPSRSATPNGRPPPGLRLSHRGLERRAIPPDRVARGPDTARAVLDADEVADRQQAIRRRDHVGHAHLWPNGSARRPRGRASMSARRRSIATRTPDLVRLAAHGDDRAVRPMRERPDVPARQRRVVDRVQCRPSAERRQRTRWSAARSPSRPGRANHPRAAGSRSPRRRRTHRRRAPGSTRRRRSTARTGRAARRARVPRAPGEESRGPAATVVILSPPSGPPSTATGWSAQAAPSRGRPGGGRGPDRPDGDSPPPAGRRRPGRMRDPPAPGGRDSTSAQWSPSVEVQATGRQSHPT